MLKTLSNLSLDIQAAVNSLTRRSRKSRAYARQWNEPQTIIGGLAGDLALFFFIGFIGAAIWWLS